jgi:hypothetical protein
VVEDERADDLTHRRADAAAVELPAEPGPGLAGPADEVVAGAESLAADKLAVPEHREVDRPLLDGERGPLTPVVPGRGPRHLLGRRQRPGRGERHEVGVVNALGGQVGEGAQQVVGDAAQLDGTRGDPQSEQRKRHRGSRHRLVPSRRCQPGKLITPTGQVANGFPAR